jgi:hypothetical protein
MVKFRNNVSREFRILCITEEIPYKQQGKVIFVGVSLF